ncbi:Holliday junction branch migration protein RuvA [Candidatus Viridilinea mediisalina]|uniref:Holliday junction branch migration complex subunit RuvA n=1 Tax=Candidatus Viridilinea mediisalina TaxID=2024553 RepID=A0A2A6RFX0_9CHLR|nr:Holliday junction branch migration protein RuvA [Candidatus Viridilinea mediisalina]PDW01775.1 Holliday junction branch migration protein RuvA [Candidatus Viridilinea mediisalina]
MIARLRGTIAHIGSDHLVIETHGVGFLVYAPRPVLANAGAIGDTMLLYTVLIVREDALTLYGFANSEQRSLFERLMSVSGVGPRVALGLLSTGTPAEIGGAIAHGDTARLARAPGVGKKTAERLVLELKGKLDLATLPPPPTGATAAAVALNNELGELLTSLGYSSAEASAAINAMPADAPEDLEERLRLALRYFGSA